MQTKVFNGHLYKDAVPRTFVAFDPRNPAKKIISKERFDLITNLVVDRVSGFGLSKGQTKEPYMTLSGQYDKYATARITASAQDAEALREVIRPYLDKERQEGQHIPLKKDLVFDVVTTRMGEAGQGYGIKELYLIDPETKEKKPIITLPTTGDDETNQQSGEGGNVPEQFL